ncbi:DUF1902 domain-containing protein [Klebsiella oxytoca]|uniref:DUF1902 domain-containing protein n=1 Tax=Klebsiella grimontii TaxID=2058152 RepID=UPI001898B984|nr:DUF1902 domain-containing protein [Klebsiella grimontii]HED2701119.1 DUF1902 domain-containing protein [Klebsiella oxytoca]HEJ8034765.1 DUF1902 domain-containing protein [Klebsiella oxytoca]HEM7496459.1 DUF1902 domain-containing protein [Klebsiella oxytoca]HEM7561314.1 DUF1902 domain-containing protein [Klebsiella oxytoca]
MRSLRCMAYQQNGVYVAACLDLSLAAQADTMKEAMSKLDAQIRDYLEEALSEPEFADQLLNRKAPLSMWIKYWIIAFRIFFDRKQGQSKLFSEPCEASA